MKVIKRLISLVVTLGLVASLFVPFMSASASTMYENYYDPAEWGGGFYTGSSYYYGQTFTPSVSHNITSVDIRLKRTGTPGGTLTATIYATTAGGAPTGAALDSGTYAGASVTTSFSWVSFTMAGAGTVSLTAGTKYAVVVTVAGGGGDNIAPNWYVWGGGSCATGTYTGGDYVADDGGWIVYSGYDLGFREYGDPLIFAPTLAIANASSISQTSARLNATVTSDGGEACQVRFAYGTTNQTAANFLLYDNVTGWQAGYVTDTHPYVDISGLNDSTTYYYRAQITNSEGTMTTVASATFDTAAGVADVDILRGYPHETSVNLSWTIAAGASNYMVRYSTTTFPADNTTGSLVYNGSGLATLHNNLTKGTNYYYSIWGYSGDNWSAAGATLLVTTLGGSPAGSDIIDGMVAPSNWFITADYTAMDGLGYFYDTVNWLGTEIGIALNWWWFLIFITIGVVLGTVVAIWGRSLTAGLMVVLVVFIIGSICRVVPGVVSAITAVVVIGFFLFNQNKGG